MSVLGESTASNRPPPSPFKPASKQAARKSLSALTGEPAAPITAKTMDDVLGSGKRKRAYSVGGIAAISGKKELSPRSQARRTAKPRKSILKTAAPSSLFSPKRQSPQSSRNAMTTARPQGSPLRQQTHAHTINFAGSGRGEEDAFTSDEEDLAIRSTNIRRPLDITFPATLPSQASGLAPPRMTGNTTSERKAQRRAEIAAKRGGAGRMSVDGVSRRKSVSWSSHAQVRMIVAQEEEEPKDKAKVPPSGMKIFEEEDPALNVRGGGVRPAFSFGGGIDGGAENVPEQVSQRGNSSRRHGRQSSITGIPVPQVTVNPVFTIPSEQDDSAMDIETDSEDDVDVDEQAVQQQLVGPQPVVRSSIFGSPEKVNNSSRRRLSVGNKKTTTAGDETEQDMSMDMDITQIVSHEILQPSGSPASTVSGGEHDDEDSDSDSDDDEVLNQSRQEERTMDFTVAIGGVIPGAPPANARENRNPVGYTVVETTTATATMTTSTSTSTEYSAPIMDDAQPRPIYASSIFSIPANRGFDQFTASTPNAKVQLMDDTEMDMEETRAFGGVLGAAPQGRIFLPDPDSSMESVEEVDQGGQSRREPTLRFDPEQEDDDAMDFTIAHGGVLDASSRSTRTRPRDGESMMQDDEDDGMDFTIARGGILPAVNVTSPTASTISQINTTFSAPGTPRAAQSPARPVVHNAYPSQPAPSYAQPTSASRARDIYGPSPSPKKVTGDSPAQPKGRSPATAMEVAKKLVFEPSPAKTSTTTSKRKSLGAQSQGQSKRKSVAATAGPGETSVFNDENAPPAAAQPVQRPGVSIFASPAKTPGRKSPMKVIVPAKSPAKPVSIFGTPKRFTGNTLTLPSPARGLLPSPAKTHGLAVPTIQEPVWEQEQYANIPLANFLAMCNVKFSDDGPGARRKSIAGLPPDLLQEMLARDEEGGFTLHDYARAQIWKPFYDMYQWGCQQMKRDYEAGQETLEAIDREASEDNPPVIRDYLAASDEEKGVFETIILNLKRNAHLIAREKWYIWKQTLVSQIQPIMEAHIEGMKEDKIRLQKVKEESDVVLPAIKARYEALRLELEQEKKIVAEIEACDQDRLAECKAELAQQNSYIAESTAELNEQKAKLVELQKKLTELKLQQDTNLTAIAIAKKECAQQKGFTKAQVYHLQDEFATLQHLHATALESLKPNELVLCFSNQLRLHLKSINWKPTTAGASLELSEESSDSAKSSYRAACLPLLQDILEAASASGDVPKMIQRIATAWGVVQELDQEFKLVALRYPTTYEWDEAVSSVKAKATIVLPAFRAKVRVGFSLTAETISSWPVSASDVPVEVEVVYGQNVDLEYLQAVAEDVMASVTPESTSGLFLNVTLGLISVQTE